MIVDRRSTVMAAGGTATPARDPISTASPPHDGHRNYFHLPWGYELMFLDEETFDANKTAFEHDPAGKDLALSSLMRQRERPTPNPVPVSPGGAKRVCPPDFKT
jgi:hypothetical protein